MLQHDNPIVEVQHFPKVASKTVSPIRKETMEMEMDSHGGLEVTIRQTESKKKTTQQLRETDP